MSTRFLWTAFLVLAVGVTSWVVAQGLPGEPGGVEAGYVEVEGGRIFYEAAGQGPAVVMIHDGVLHRETWNAQFAEFAKSRRVLRWDRRGYGRSEAPTAPFVNIDDLHAVMTALGVARATLVGCSFGGLLSIEFTLTHPEMVSSLVLVGPIVSGFGFSEHFATRGGRGMPDRDASVDQKIEYWTTRDRWVMAPESGAARKTMASLLAANPHNMVGSGRFTRWPGFSCMERLSEIKVPTLIVVGESDIPDVHSHVGVIQAGIAESKRVVLPHGGHLVHIEVPDEFNRVVLEFLESVG
jgi:pimeloyl-ACP methyl ester carboxylesterase